MSGYRLEKDSLGEVRVPAGALYGAQTQRAIENFPVSGVRFPPVFIRALAMIKESAALVNAELGLLDRTRADAVIRAAREVSGGMWEAQFPLDVFQTGSGTSTNMNANEVIARRASQILGQAGVVVHPNDHVNMSQSSNDVIPTALHLSACLSVREDLMPSLSHLHEALRKREAELQDVVKTGRTHLMDAVPLRLGQEVGGWAFQVSQGIDRIGSCLPRLQRLAIGGTAVGTGLNAHPEFGGRVVAKLSGLTGIPFTETENHFAAQASMDTAVEFSGHLKASATGVMKIANDLRLMNSGPVTGFAEISLPVLQPGSSIMPGKVNPVICEAVSMACGQVIGNDAAITVGNLHGSFELNVMLPLISRNLLESILLLGNACRVLADRAVAGFVVHRQRISELVGRNPILATALAPVVGYDKTAEIVRRATAEQRSIREVAAEMTGLDDRTLDRLLDPLRMTGPE
ncbi:MAG: class II fumarate hydratase [Thermodesulfovibrionales bacterium]